MFLCHMLRKIFSAINKYVYHTLLIETFTDVLLSISLMCTISPNLCQNIPRLNWCIFLYLPKTHLSFVILFIWLIILITARRHAENCVALPLTNARSSSISIPSQQIYGFIKFCRENIKYIQLTQIKLQSGVQGPPATALSKLRKLC